MSSNYFISLVGVISELRNQEVLASLEQAILLSQSRLQILAENNEFQAKMKLAFGATVDSSALQSAWTDGDFSSFPTIEVRYQSELNGAIGAYSASRSSIYLAYEYLQQESSIEAIATLFLEEYGHHLDVLLNGSNDSAGDEGHIFATLAMGETLSTEALASLQAENDHGVVSIDGETVAVEMATFTGTAGNDSITGTDDDDVIDGLGGNDTLDGAGGSNTVRGGDGDDEIINLLGSVDGNEGIDTLIADYTNVSLSNNDGLGIRNVFASVNAVRLLSDFDTILLSLNGIEKINLTGTSLDDSLRGGSSNDTLNGGLGDDTISGGVGDILDGGEGEDTISIDLRSAITDLTLNLNLSGFQLQGDSQTQVSNFEELGTIRTGSGNDTIIDSGTNRAGSIYLGDGDDTVNLTHVGGYIWSRIVDGELGTDTLILDYTNASHPDLTDGFGIGNNAPIGPAYNIFTRLGDEKLIWYYDFEKLNITGTSLDDVLGGFAGDDTLNGGMGNDTVSGEGGNDRLSGVNPNNPLPGINEIDRLTGGIGEDTFFLGDLFKPYYDDNDPTTSGFTDYAHITDLNVTEDKIQLNGIPANYSLANTTIGDASGTGIYLNKPNGEPNELIAFLQDITALDLSSNVFLFVDENNEPPTDISLSNNNVDENQPINTTIGTFTTTDPDIGETFTYSLVAGEGDTHNNLFNITGNTLNSNTIFNYEDQNSYTIRVQTRDSDNNTYSEAFTININDLLDELTINVNGVDVNNSLERYGEASVFNGNSLPQDTDDALITYLDNGNEVKLENNSWKDFDLSNYTITGNTQLIFEFRSENEAEIQGLGLDRDDDLFNDTSSIFQLYGTQTFGNQAFNNYQGLNDVQAVDGWKEYEISLGQYLTGDYDRLVFFNNFDANNNIGGSAQFRNIVLLEDSPIPNNPPVANDDNYTTDEATIINDNFVSNDNDLDNDSLIITEINGSIFTEDNPITLASGALLTINNDGTFSYDPNNQFDNLLMGEIATDSFTYTISDGQDSDTATVDLTINGLSFNTFSIDANGTVINYSDDSDQSYGKNQDFSDDITFADNTAILGGNTWKALGLDYNITPDTVLTFDFKSNQIGEIHGIGFEDDLNLSQDKIFNLYGTQNDWGIRDFRYTNINDWQRFEIDLGSFITEDINYVILTNDDDANANANSQFRNIVLSENHSIFTNNTPVITDQLTVTIDGTAISNFLERYGEASVLNGNSLPQDTDDAVITYSDNGNEVKLENNSWKDFDLSNYTITENTRLKFEFRSENEAEIQGLGLDKDDDLFNDTSSIFQLYGTQTFGNQAFNDYQGLNDAQAVDGWKEYEISLGQYFTGDYDRLVFFNDFDANNNIGGSAEFRNIVLEEVS